MVSSLCCSAKYLTPDSMLYINKCKIRLRILLLYLGRCYPVLTVQPQYSKVICSLVDDDLFFTQQPLSTVEILQVSHCSINITMANIQMRQSLVPPVQIFRVRTCHDMFTMANHSHSQFSLVKCKLHSGSFFSKTVTLWNRCLWGYFADHYNFKFFKSRVNRYPSYICC